MRGQSESLGANIPNLSEETIVFNLFLAITLLLTSSPTRGEDLNSTEPSLNSVNTQTSAEIEAQRNLNSEMSDNTDNDIDALVDKAEQETRGEPEWEEL
jgi:hypothetical protein